MTTTKQGRELFRRHLTSRSLEQLLEVVEVYARCVIHNYGTARRDAAHDLADVAAEIEHRTNNTNH